jgi:hypothetical protein
VEREPNEYDQHHHHAAKRYDWIGDDRYERNDRLGFEHHDDHNAALRPEIHRGMRKGRRREASAPFLSE